MDNKHRLEILSQENATLVSSITLSIINTYSVDIGPDSYYSLIEWWSYINKDQSENPVFSKRMEDIYKKTDRHLYDFTNNIVRRVLSSKKLDSYVDEYKRLLVHPSEYKTRSGITMKYSDYWLKNLGFEINHKNIDKYMEIAKTEYDADIDILTRENQQYCGFDDGTNEISIMNFGNSKFKPSSTYIGMYQYIGFLMDLLYTHPMVKKWGSRLREENYLRYIFDTQTNIMFQKQSPNARFKSKKELTDWVKGIIESNYDQTLDDDLVDDLYNEVYKYHEWKPKREDIVSISVKKNYQYNSGTYAFLVETKERNKEFWSWVKSVRARPLSTFAK